jgi:methylglutaconyl-CoA hydratase
VIRYETKANVAAITLDTPENANKFTYQLMNDFIDSLTTAAASGAIVLVLQATGKDFTLGRDQNEQLANISRRDSLRLILKANDALQQFPGVSIALIQGRCMGFGTGLSLRSNISIGTHDSILGFDEIKHGFAPLVVQTYLSNYVGPKTANELVVTGRDVPAEEAVRLGLLTKVVPRDRLAEEGKKLAAELTTLSSGALRLIHRFGEELSRFRGDNAGELAIERLAQWIEAGRP